MNKQKAACITASFFCLGLSLAKAQYYPSPPPPGYYAPPPAYLPPPPPPPPPAPWFPGESGPYFRMGLGPSFYQDGTLKQFTIPGIYNGLANQPVRYDTGFTFSAAFGYAFNKYVGLDFETGYLYANINNVTGYFSNNSYIANVPLLVNCTLSLPIPHTILVPYIGGGGGGSVSFFNANAFGDQSGNAAFNTESDTVYAYQGFAGLNFKLSQEISVGFGYKYFATGDPTFSYPPGPNLNISFKGVRTHSIMFTFQAKF